MTRKSASKAIGQWLANGVMVAAGYVWCAHGLLWGAAIPAAAAVVIGLAVLGAFAYADQRRA